MTRWQRHTDPLLVPYNVPPLAQDQEEQFWEYWTSKPSTVSLAGEMDGRLIAHVLLRAVDLHASSADLGISMDPACIGAGIGTKLLQLTRTYAGQELGIRTITLDVAAWNRRALRAYEKAGFQEIGRRWVQWDTPVDLRALLAQAGNEWLAEFVRIDTGYTIVEVRMCAQETRSI